jgi:hypothetical protein
MDHIVTMNIIRKRKLHEMADVRSENMELSINLYQKFVSHTVASCEAPKMSKENPEKTSKPSVFATKYFLCMNCDRCFITTAFQLCFRICHQEGPRKSGGTEIKWDTSAARLCR